MYEYHSTSFIQTKQFGWVQKAEAINSFLIEELRLEMKLRFQNIYLLDMFKKTLLILAIICLVFSQTFACKKKVKGAWKKVKGCSGCLKRPNRKPLLSPSPSVASSSSGLSWDNYPFSSPSNSWSRSRKGKNPSHKFIINCFRGIKTSSDFKTFSF